MINSINSCPADVKESAFKNIVVTGSLTRLKGFSDFMNDHVSKAANVKTFRESLARHSRAKQMSGESQFSIESRIHPNASNSVFEGCVEMQQQEFMQKRFIERGMFEEFGAAIVRRHFYAFPKHG